MTIPAGMTAYVATNAPTMNGDEGTITMTCPKTGIAGGDPIAATDNDPGDWNFEDSPKGVTATPFEPAEVSADRKSVV